MSQQGDGRDITWTKRKLKRFEAAHGEATGKKADQFTFEGHLFLTSYAKYLIEYLKTRLGDGE